MLSASRARVQGPSNLRAFFTNARSLRAFATITLMKLRHVICLSIDFPFFDV